MAYHKKVGILEGKFTKKVSETLYKFQGVGNISYIECKWPPELDRHSNIRVKDKGMLGAFKRFQMLGFAPYSKVAKAHITKKVKEQTASALEASKNAAFSEGKYKTYGYDVPVARGHAGVERSQLRKATRELTRILRDLPENQIDVFKETSRKNRGARIRELDIQDEILSNEVFAATEADGLADRNSGKYDELGMTKFERQEWDKKQAEKAEKEAEMEKEIADFFNE